MDNSAWAQLVCTTDIHIVPIPINKNIFYIGRSKESDLIIKDNPYVSNRHCHITKENDSIFIYDTSINGIIINGKKRVCKTNCVLLHGDEIYLFYHQDNQLDKNLAYMFQELSKLNVRDSSDSSLEINQTLAYVSDMVNEVPLIDTVKRKYLQDTEEIVAKKKTISYFDTTNPDISLLPITSQSMQKNLIQSSILNSAEVPSNSLASSATSNVLAPVTICNIALLSASNITASKLSFIMPPSVDDDLVPLSTSLVSQSTSESNPCLLRSISASLVSQAKSNCGVLSYASDTSVLSSTTNCIASAAPVVGLVSKATSDILLSQSSGDKVFPTSDNKTYHLEEASIISASMISNYPVLSTSDNKTYQPFLDNVTATALSPSLSAHHSLKASGNLVPSISASLIQPAMSSCLTADKLVPLSKSNSLVLPDCQPSTSRCHFNDEQGSTTTTKKNKYDDADDDADDDDDLFDSLTCQICHDIYYKCIGLQPCMHSFCSGCYSQWMKLSNDCPTCRMNVERINSNHIINNLVETYLKMHPDKKRKDDDLKEMDLKNTITKDMTLIKKKKVPTATLR